jgi:hypothetical protein
MRTALTSPQMRHKDAGHGGQAGFLLSQALCHYVPIPRGELNRWRASPIR